MTLSLDTNVFIDLLRRRDSPVREAFSRALGSGEPLVASMIVAHELLFGAALHPDPAAQRERVGLVLAQVTVEPFDGRDMAVAAAIRADLKRRGAPIGPYDALIAGQTLARGWTMVTGNVREFARVADLTIVDWTAAAPGLA